MKYPRNTRIFRGQLDVAPVACLFFMTAILLFLHSQIVFTPGVRLDLHPSADTNRPSLYIDSENIFHYADSTMSAASFAKRVRADAAKNKLPSTLLLQTELGVSTNSINIVRELAGEGLFTVEPPGTRIELPELADQPGVASPSVIVSVNMNGQFFYENQIVKETSELQQRLASAAKESREPLTLILRLDKAVAVQTLMDLSQMAHDAGFRDVVLSSRPPLKPVEGNTN
jgi:biopolymer transport protein ExbD